MRTGMVALALLATIGSAPGQNRVLELRSRDGSYQGGKVEFLGFEFLDQLVHFEPGKAIPLRLRSRYRVLETAPVLLNSRFGTEYWRLCSYPSGEFAALHCDERMDLSKPGEAETVTTQMTSEPKYYGLPSKGLCGMRGRHYWLVDQPNGDWLAAVDPPGYFDSRELIESTLVTLVDLTTFRLELADVRSTWQPGGLFQFRIEVVDAAGERFPVLSPEARVVVAEQAVRATPQFGPLGIPTGWLEARLPAAPHQVSLVAEISCMTPQGRITKEVKELVDRGTGQVSEAELQAASPAAVEVRNADGVLRETRALWVQRADLLTREAIDDVVERAKAARLNVLVPNVMTRSTAVVHSDVFPFEPTVEPGLDPLAYLIEQAHTASLEVHPWFTCTYRDAKGRAAVGGGVDLIDAKGNVVPLGACNHRPAYRDFITKLMIGVARDYPVDGIHFDYIRVMNNCYCDGCRREFQAQFGHPLGEATPDEWIAWNRQAIGDVVQRVSEGVRKVRPQAILSAAVFDNLASGASQGQDPGSWANRGWLDVAIPMDYDADSVVVRSGERGFLDILDDDQKLVTGLSIYTRNGGEATPREPALLAEQVRMVRGMGIHGYCLFVSKYLDDGRLEVLRDELNPEPAVPWFR